MSIDKVHYAIKRYDLKQFLDELELQNSLSLSDASKLVRGVGLLFSALNAAAMENITHKDHIRELTDKVSQAYLALERRELELQRYNNDLIEQIKILHSERGS